MAARDEYPVQKLQLQDGRTLAYALLGAPLEGAAAVIVYHHGTPAGLVEAEPLAAAAPTRGVAIVAFDRSGMGESSPNRRMSVQSVVDDTRQLMDHLHLASAVQVGESGGAPYAAACGVALPDRVQQVVLLAGIAAVDGKEHAAQLAGVNALDRWSMPQSWARRLGAAHALHWVMRLMVNRMPGKIKEGAGDELGPSDAAYLEGAPAEKDWLVRFMQRGYRQGIGGVMRDYRVLAQPWGVDVGALRCRTAIWHGEDDRVLSQDHPLWWQAAVPAAQLHMVPNEGHISLAGRHAAAILEDALAGAAAPTNGA